VFVSRKVIGLELDIDSNAAVAYIFGWASYVKAKIEEVHILNPS
jgi:hypothetical protein